MLKKSVIIANRHSTSISLEEEFWQELQKIASAQNMSINQLVTIIDSQRQNNNLSSAVRIHILNHYRFQ